MKRLAFAVLLACAACPPPAQQDGGVTDSDAGLVDDAGAPESTCTPDPMAIAEQRACVSDDQCPCGAHCDLGRCVATCGAGLPACGAAQTCDRFGRCRNASDRTLVGEVAARTPSALSLDRTTLLVGTESDAATLTLRSVNRATDRVRVTVPRPYQVRCGGSSAWASECSLSSVAMNAEADIVISVTPGMTATGPAQLRVFSGSSMQYVTLQPRSTNSTMAFQTPQPGRYEGTLSLVGFGLTDGGAPLAAKGLSAPLRLTVFDGASLVFDLVDPLRALVSDGRLVASATRASTTSPARLSLPRFLITRGAVSPGTSLDAVAEPQVTDVQFDATSGSLAFELTVVVRGVTEGQGVFVQRWTAVLSQRPDAGVPSSPPALTQPVAVPDAGALTSTAWHAATLDAMPAWGTAARPETDFQLLLATSGDVQGAASILPACTSTSCPRRLEACARPAAPIVVPQTLWNTTTAASWASPNFTSGTPVDVSVASTGRPLANVLLRPVTTGVLGVRNAAFTTDAGAGVPCEVVFNTNATNTCLSGPQDYGRIDRCAELARTTGCEPVEVSSPSPTFVVTGTVDLPGAPATCTSNVVVTGAVTKLCRSSGRAPCGELLSCLAGSATTALDRAAPLHPRGGDLDCLAPPTGSRRSLATRAELAAEAGAVRAGDIAASCLADLARLQGAVPSPATLQNLFSADAGCLDTPRHLVALEYATEVDRRRALGLSTTVDVRDSRFAHRLAQQWLDVHGLVASEANQRLAVPDPALTGLSGLPALPPANEVLARSLDGWNVLLHPRFASALANLPDDVLLAPDYRAPLRSVPAVADHAQPVGLPVALLRTLEVQLGLTRTALEDAARRNDRTVLASAGRMFRTASLAEAVARHLFDRASAAATVSRPLRWRDAWGRALRSYETTRDSAVAAAAALEEGRNPLGVEESDLPLYFFGGETGPSARFSAVSDYLLGAAGSTSAWAPSLVAAASQSATAMRTAYRDQAIRQYQEALGATAAADRLDDVRGAAGATLSTLCGTPMGLAPSNILEGWQAATGRPFDGTTCYRRLEKSGCSQPAAQALTLDDVKLHLCTTVVVNSMTANAVRYANDGLTQLSRGERLRGLTVEDVSAVVNATTTGLVRCVAEACPATAPTGAVCLRCGATGAVATALTLDQRIGLDTVSATLVDQAEQVCGALYPRGRVSLSALLPRLGADATASAQCLTGTLGELAMTAEAAATDIEIAREEAASLDDAYDISMRSCFVQQAGDAAIDAELAKFNRETNALSDRKFALDAAAHAAGAAKDCAATAAGMSENIIIGASGTAAACAAAFAEAALTIASDKLQVDMDKKERAHQATLQALAANTAFQVCTNDATMQLVGLRAATLRVQRASQDLGLALFRLGEAERAAQTAFDEGLAALEDARGRSFRPPAIDGWVEANVAQYQRAMRLARRMTYLSVRAVEYEYQASLMARADVLSADTPDQLQQVIDGLRATAGTRRINGRAPSALKAVVSLRQHVLQLSDRSQLSAKEQALSEVQLFRTRLKTRYLVTDALGRPSLRVPFALAPLGGTRPGNGMGVPIFSTSDCAERLWSVNASILGTPRLYRGDATTFTRVSLEKSNTFFSQWCGTPPAGAPPFQWASVRPSVNLFQDPVFGPGRIGTTALGGTLGVRNAVDDTSQARIQAYFNVPRATFEADSYANGETAELAGRGLYGQYELVIPAEVISTNGSNGLDLDQVDDILLRLDYVSVANQ